jgi:hypothetical protein
MLRINEVSVLTACRWRISKLDEFLAKGLKVVATDISPTSVQPAPPDPA